MFKRTGYFNPTGFRRTTLSPYAPVTPRQAANRFILEYVPSYVPPPPPPPPPAPVIDNGGGDNIAGPGSYQVGNSGNFSPLDDAYDDEMGDTNISLGTETSTPGVSNVWSYEDDYSEYANNPGGAIPGDYSPPASSITVDDRYTGTPTSGGIAPDMADAMSHHSSGIHDGGNDHGGHDGHSGGNASDGSEANTGGGYGALGHSDGGKIPPMYANQGMAMPDMPEKEINSFQDLTGKLSTMTGIPSNIGTVTDQQRSSFNTGQVVGKDKTNFDTVMNAVSAAPAMAKDYVEKEIDTAKENPLEAAVKALTNFGVTKGLNIKAFSPQAFVASAIINDIFDSQYDGLLDGPNSEVDMSANNTTGYTSNPSQMDASSHPSFGNIESIESVSPEIDAAINDIANEIDTSTTSSPPSTISDHANVHGDSPSPATPDMGTDFGDGYNSAEAPSVGSGMSNDGDFGGHPGMGGGSNSPGNDGGMQGGADDPAGAGAGMGGYGDGAWSKGGRIYASQGGYVNSTGGK
jgi:hypothetical protein